MKNKIALTVYSLLFTVVGLNQNVFAQQKKEEEIKIKTSSVCNQCKKTLESNLIYERGVKDVHLDVASKELTIHYNTAKTDPTSLRKAISELGYDADTIPANKKAYEKLKDCCRKESEIH